MSTPEVPRGCLAPLVDRQSHYASMLAGASPSQVAKTVRSDCNKQLAILFCVLQGLVLAIALLLVSPRIVRYWLRGRRTGTSAVVDEKKPRRSHSEKPSPQSSVESGWAHQRPPPASWSSRMQARGRHVLNRLLLPTLPVINLSVGQLGVLGIYAALVVFIAVFKVGSWSENPTRFAYVAVAQIPAMFILAMKNNPLAILGVGYDRVNFVHRFASRLFVLFFVIHGSYYYNQSRLGQAKDDWGHHIVTGSIVLGFASIMFVTGLRPIRTRIYQIFLYLHVAGFIAILVALWYHDEATHPFLIAAFVAVGLDHVLKAARTRIVEARITSSSALLTRIDVPGMTKGWHAGEHVLVRVIRAPRVVEKHPFTIASASATRSLDRASAHLVLIAKTAGDFTKSLHRLAGTDVGSSKNVRMSIEGPYGGNGWLRTQDFSAAALISSGSGMTFVIGQLEELVAAKLDGTGRTTRILVIWTIRDLDMMAAFADQISRILTAARRAKLTVTFRLHVTSSQMRRPSDGVDVPDGVQLVPSRPQMETSLSGLVDEVADDGETEGVVVAVCGPVSLVASCRDAVRTVDATRVGGFVLHSEASHW